MSLDEEHVYAAGGVLWRRAGRPDGETEVALVHRPRYDDWSLPKGKLHRGEHPLVGACREIVEETAAHPVAGPYLATVSYDVPVDGRTAPKTVEYWSMRAAEQGVFAADEEISDVRWLPAAAAGAQLTYPRDRDVLARHVALPPVTGAVLVIRHGYAGSRSEWDGPDDERPLDERGRAQAVAMAQVLTWYAPERVLSAPAVRCVQSAQPLAFVTGVPVEIDPVLSEDFHRRDERATAARIRELGSTGLTTAIVSQGKVIPEAIAQIAADDGLGLRKVASRKGSAWALFFSGSRLIAADYRNDLEASPR